MAVTLGKRKRRNLTVSDEPRRQSTSEDEDTARALFQKAFEAKFKPLDKPAKPKVTDQTNDSDTEDIEDGLDNEESDWSGLSGEEDEVETVEFAQPSINDIFDGDGGKKRFMSSKPPTLGEDAPTRSKPAKSAEPEADDTETANLKNDLALQRLLKESHILDPAAFRASSAVEGKGRLKALDMRLKDLGAKASFLEQEKMPLAHRKGIAAKGAAREASRRKEAAENGIILEKAKFAAKSDKRRERSIAGPGVGKFRGGTLKLSSRDINSIQGPPSSRRKGGKRR